MPDAINLNASVELKSGCKINFCLEITGQRADGYHTLHSYFVPLAEPHDVLGITILQNKKAPLCLVNSSALGIDPANNTITKAYKLLFEKIPTLPAIQVNLQKNVPQGAGLGGGSANAAVLLNFLNSLASASGTGGLNQAELLAIAARVGADVPFFIIGKAAWVSGIGEQIKPCAAALEPYQHMYLLLVCPGVHVSTPWAFKEWDNLEKSGANALTSYPHQDSNISADSIYFVNNLETPVFAAFPNLKKLKDTLLLLGAEHAVMSGSGSSIFGLFASKSAALAAGEVLRADGLNVFVQALYTGVSPSW